MERSRETYDPVKTLRQLDEGRLADDLDAELAEVVQQFLEHRRKYTDELTEKTKATLVFEITVAAGPQGTASFKGTFKKKLPGRPASITMAVHEYDEGKPALLVPRSGSHSEDPRQMKLATEDGRAIDPSSREALPPKKTPERN